jgi:hypothetical protein
MISAELPTKELEILPEGITQLLHSIGMARLRWYPVVRMHVKANVGVGCYHLLRGARSIERTRCCRS